MTRRGHRQRIYDALYLFDTDAAETQQQIDREGVWWRRLLKRISGRGA